MNLVDALRAVFGGGKGTPPPVAGEVVKVEAAGLERQVLREGEGRSVYLANSSEQDVYGLFLDSFVGGAPPPKVMMGKGDEGKFQTLTAFVLDVFSPGYLRGVVGAASSPTLLPPSQSDVFRHIVEGREYLKLPNKNGVTHFFRALYDAEQHGLSLEPPIVAHNRFRPDIVRSIRHGVFEGGLGLAKKFARYGDAGWEGKAAEQLLFIHGLAQMYGVPLQQIVHGDLLETVTTFRDLTRQRTDFLRREATGLPEDEKRERLARADELERTYLSTSEKVGMPLPLSALRLGRGSANWQ